MSCLAWVSPIDCKPSSSRVSQNEAITISGITSYRIGFDVREIDE